MTTQAKSTLWEILRNLAIYGILLIGSTYVLASRLEIQVQANREEARRELAAAVNISDVKHASFEKRLDLYEDNQKKIAEEIRLLRETISASNKETSAFREETVTAVAVLCEQVKGLRSDLNDYRVSRKP